MTEPHAPYIGRFAPSPTGPLHFGSLVAATGSYLQARSRGGRWLLRIEDIDPPREVPGAADTIIRTLETYGFEWDGPILWQSRRREHYEEALRHLENEGRIYACNCSRKTIAAANPGGKPRRYPGTCRERGLPLVRDRQHSLRLRTEDTPLCFEDGLFGPQAVNLYREGGDFVVFRRDGFHAYVLAVSVDDRAQGITEVVRGGDLLDATAAQIWLLRQLGASAPGYFHLPVVTNENGEKLSKQTGAKPLPSRQPGKQIWRALRFLGQSPPAELATANPAECWQWAQENWHPRKIPRNPAGSV